MNLWYRYSSDRHFEWFSIGLVSLNACGAMEDGTKRSSPLAQERSIKGILYLWWATNMWYRTGNEINGTKEPNRRFVVTQLLNTCVPYFVTKNVASGSTRNRHLFRTRYASLFWFKEKENWRWFSSPIFHWFSLDHLCTVQGVTKPNGRSFENSRLRSIC